MSETAAFGITLTLFTITYTGLALGRLPGLLTDRAGIAWAGAAAIMASGLLSFDEAVQAVDFATLGLLLGMMVLVAFLRESGFFELLAGRALARFRNPPALLAAVMLLSGALSAVLVNDVVCLALVPLVLHLTQELKIDPKPHLIGLAIASNIGSTATPTGNPQNMIIASLSRVGYLRFAAELAPVAVTGLAVAYALTYLICRSSLRAESASAANGGGSPPRPRRRARRNLLRKSGAVALAAVGLFFAGAPMAVVALGGAAVLLLDRIKPERIYRRIDWGLLVMFAGLFVVVRAFEMHVLKRAGIERWTAFEKSPVALLGLASAALSNLVSNVPAVLLFKPVVAAMPGELRETAWLSLAMSSTLAGNLTVLGSVANLIVVENARRGGVAISAWEYCRVGVPVTVATLLLGVAWMCAGA